MSYKVEAVGFDCERIQTFKVCRDCPVNRIANSIGSKLIDKSWYELNIKQLAFVGARGLDPLAQNPSRQEDSNDSKKVTFKTTVHPKDFPCREKGAEIVVRAILLTEH